MICQFETTFDDLKNFFLFLFMNEYVYMRCRDILQMILKKNSHFFDNFLRLIVKIKVVVFILCVLFRQSHEGSKIKSPK